MVIFSIFIFMAILIPVGLFISRPFFDSSSRTLSGNDYKMDHSRSNLLAERDRILSALSELDFDNKLGKIPAEDYQYQRTQLLEKGAGILRKLDEIEKAAGANLAGEKELGMSGSPPAALIPESQSVRSKTRKHPHTPDDELEALLAERRRNRQEKAAGFCHKCGGALHKSDMFCPKCGARIY